MLPQLLTQAIPLQMLPQLLTQAIPLPVSHPILGTPLQILL
jgi:hypothetical protein